MPQIICSVAIIVLTFLPMKLVLLGHAPEFDKAVVSICLSGLGGRIWPAVFITMLVVAGLSVFATHTLAGPLRRPESIGKGLAAGEVPASSVSADLKEIAAHLDDLEETLRPFNL